jgi:cytochrome c oxidase cbb3-type subunit 3
MPAHAHLDQATVDNLANYVVSLSGRNADAAKAEAGKEAFMTSGCVACHGIDGKGNQILGAPNLTDNIWLYGASLGAIKQSIVGGRNGVMPAHDELLGPEKVHLLTAYVYGLSQQ